MLALGLSLTGQRRRAAALDAVAALAPYARWRLDLGATLNGSNLAALADQSGNARDLAEATAGNQSPYSASDAAFGGHPIMATGASTKGVQAATATPWRFLHDGTGMSVFLVARTRGPAGNRMLGTGHSAGTVFAGFTLIPWVSDNLLVSVGNGAADVISFATTASSYPSTVGHCVLLTYRSGVDPDCAVEIDGVAAGTGSELAAPAAGDPFGPFSLGYPTNKAGGCDSDIAECALWNRVLSTPEKAQLRAYALARYGV
jgi:hypothetical protein